MALIDFTIRSPADARMEELCGLLAQSANGMDSVHNWPSEHLEMCARYGVFGWFLDQRFGGQEWPDETIAEGYFRLAEACLTTTFIITQRQAACSRIAASVNKTLQTRLLPDLCKGRLFTTVGISHLSTSRRHLARPTLSATKITNGYRLDGYSPWVTGAAHADVIVMGAALDKDNQVLLAVPTDIGGLMIEPPVNLTALSASHTTMVRFQGVEVDSEWLIAGPMENVIKFGGSGTGGLQTSALAIGLSTAAIRFLQNESEARGELLRATTALDHECQMLRNDLLAITRGSPKCSNEELRARSNSLAVRSTQAALTAAKGAGFVVGHPVGRWCREALFFLVWSCPQPVANSNLCELAGLDA